MSYFASGALSLLCCVKSIEGLSSPLNVPAPPKTQCVLAQLLPSAHLRLRRATHGLTPGAAGSFADLVEVHLQSESFSEEKCAFPLTLRTERGSKRPPRTQAPGTQSSPTRRSATAMRFVCSYFALTVLISRCSPRPLEMRIEMRTRINF